jgi:hypothetical protein
VGQITEKSFCQEANAIEKTENCSAKRDSVEKSSGSP